MLQSSQTRFFMVVEKASILRCNLPKLQEETQRLIRENSRWSLHPFWRVSTVA
jgi:hypothetical protein